MFRKKRDNYVANITRKIIGDYINRPNNPPIPTSSIDDVSLESTPEAVAAMLLFGFVTLKYGDPKMSDAAAMRNLLEQREYSPVQIKEILAASKGSLFNMIYESMKVTDSEAAYRFSDEELTYFLANIKRSSPIFKEIKVY